MLKTNKTNRKDTISTKTQINKKDEPFLTRRDLNYILRDVALFTLLTTNEKFYALLLVWVFKFCSELSKLNWDPVEKELERIALYRVITKITIMLNIGTLLLLIISQIDPCIPNIPIIPRNVNILISMFLYLIHHLCILFCFMPFLVFEIRIARNLLASRRGFLYALSDYYFRYPWTKIIYPGKILNYPLYLALLFYGILGIFWKMRNINSLIPINFIKNSFEINIQKAADTISMISCLRPNNLKFLKLGVVGMSSNKLIFVFRSMPFLAAINSQRRELGEVLFTPLYVDPHHKLRMALFGVPYSQYIS
jgi:hypothetical protein